MSRLPTILRIFLLVLICLIHTHAPAATPVLEADRIVAIVGNQIITFQELARRQKLTQVHLKTQGTPLLPEAVLQQQLLERMILDEIQAQAARESGISIEEPQVDGAIKQIAAGNKLTEAQLLQKLEKDGVEIKQFREDLVREMLISRLREREVDSKISVSEAEIDLWLKNREAAANQGTQYLTAHILIRVPEGASSAELSKLRIRAEQTLDRAKKGANFAELAANTSEAPDALQGGVLGWRTLNEIPSLFAEIIPKLPVGGVSELLRSPNGFHIVKLFNQQGGESARFAPVRQTHARHILMRVSQVISEDEIRHKLTNVRERLLNGADFAEIARLYSQDGSASKGGDLGWLYPGDTVSEFEKAMDALKEHEISQIIRTSFGFHLLEVLERRMQDIPEERRRVVAKQAIRDRKSEEAYRDWLHQLRDSAYVENRLNEK